MPKSTQKLTLDDFRADLTRLSQHYNTIWEWHEHAVDLIRMYYQHIREECLVELGMQRREREGDRRGGQAAEGGNDKP